MGRLCVGFFLILKLKNDDSVNLYKPSLFEIDIGFVAYQAKSGWPAPDYLKNQNPSGVKYKYEFFTDLFFKTVIESFKLTK